MAATTESMGHRSAWRIAGKGIPVKDAREKVTGALKYAVDLEVQGMVHGKILRSPHAHARIVSIDTTRAEALPGVLGVVTHHDTPQNVWENAWFNYRGKILDGIARFHGDDMAAVAAVSEDVAEAALELIDVEYEILDAVFDPEEAMQPEARRYARRATFVTLMSSSGATSRREPTRRTSSSRPRSALPVSKWLRWAAMPVSPNGTVIA